MNDPLLWLGSQLVAVVPQRALRAGMAIILGMTGTKLVFEH